MTFTPPARAPSPTTADGPRLFGGYQEIRALTPTPAGLPWLAKLVGPNLVNQPNGAIYTLQGGDVPLFVLHLDHQVRTLQLEVFVLKALGDRRNPAHFESWTSPNITIARPAATPTP